jgi:hypothetical protein
MSSNKPEIKRLNFKGLEMAPSQVWGGVRLVPLLRRHCPGDLRLSKRCYNADQTVVDLDDGTVYSSYVPHALVTSWSDDGTALAESGSCLLKGAELKTRSVSGRKLKGMAQREGSNRLRFLPMHLAMEGFLGLHFAGPDKAWDDYSADAIYDGLGCRTEYVYDGYYIQGLADALRVFEIHEQQVGVLVFVADALASAFVVSHPDDYRALHQSLIEDFYGELIYKYGYLYPNANRLETYIDDKEVTSLADLRQALAKLRSDWAQFHATMAVRLFEREVLSKPVSQMGPFQLQQFLQEIELRNENHIGEAITRADGTLEYLKTYRLSAQQCRRGHLLNQLAKHDWNISETAKAFQYTYDQLISYIEKLRFGYLLKKNNLYKVINVDKDDWLWVRRKPGAKASKAYRLTPKAKEIELTGQEEALRSSFWVEIKHKGRIGWVDEYFIEKYSTEVDGIEDYP